MTPEVQAAITAVVAACLVALVRKAVPRIDGPRLVGLALVVAGSLVGTALHYLPTLLALLPPWASALLVGAASSFVAMGGVELLRSMGSRVNVQSGDVEIADLGPKP